MAAHRHWRVTGVLVAGSTLELTDCMLLVGGAVPSPAPTLTAPVAPSSGTLSTLLSSTASDIVSWPVAAVRTPGFALVFDCGVAGTVETPGLRLGAGSSRGTFPRDLIIESSDDGANWDRYQSYVDLSYPGDFALTAFSGNGDPEFASVVLLLSGDGANNSTVFTDSSPLSLTGVVQTTAKISTAIKKYGTASMSFDGTGSGTTGSNVIFTHGDFAFGLQDFTIEGWMYFNSVAGDGGFGSLVTFTESTGLKGVSLWQVGDRLRVRAGRSQVGVLLDSIHPQTLAINTWYYVAVCRASGSLTVYLDGVGATAVDASAINMTNSDFAVGRAHTDSAVSQLNGYIDDLRVTKGLARYTANFTPPIASFPSSTAGTGTLTPTTWNPLTKGSACTLSNGDLTAASLRTGGSAITVQSVITGKFYWEIAFSGREPIIGVASPLSARADYPGASPYEWVYAARYAQKFNNGAATAYTTSESGVVGIALNADTGTIEFFTNGVSMGVAFTAMTGPFYAITGGDVDSSVSTAIANFGQTSFQFTPPVGYLAGFGAVDLGSTLLTDTSTPRAIEFTPTLQLIAGAELDPFTAYPLNTLGYTVYDSENGGTGRVYGTVKEKSTPANVPLNRKVLLMDERSGLVIRGTWSDAVTGAFEFRDIAMGRAYTTISYDHLRNYRAVIADNQLPELQA